VIKAVIQALRGPRVGWSSIARTGKVQLGGQQKRRRLRLLSFIQDRYARIATRIGRG
jgi:hypothetical protein